MTREEVIKWLESLKREVGKAENRTLWHYAESIDTAIKVLEDIERWRTWSHTYDNLISRQEAIDGFYNVKVHEEDCTEYDIGYNDGIDYAISKLSVMPSALPSADRPTVDKEYLIDLIQEAVYDGEACAKLIDLVDRPTGWIPVSESLPIPPTFCLATTDGSHGDVIDIALYMSDGWHKASEVLAWMPLPEPYKGGESDG